MYFASGLRMNMMPVLLLLLQRSRIKVGVKPHCLRLAIPDILPVIYKDRTVLVSNPTEFPEVTDSTSKVKEVQEPIVNASIIVPDGQLNHAMQTLSS
jgi:translation elongation factor EF-4